MEAAGLVQRQPHPTDRRLVRLVLTDKGRDLESVIGREMDQLNDRALASLSAGERTALVNSLKRDPQQPVGAPDCSVVTSYASVRLKRRLAEER